MRYVLSSRYKKLTFPPKHPLPVEVLHPSPIDMQAQSVRTDTQCITSTQSLAAIQTLLRAGLGCITFLRNLLPDENFTQNYMTSATDLDDPSDSSMSSADHTRRRNVSGFKITTMARGYTEEADRILNYLEYGIFDALQRQYLRSFIFAIYLDSKDPNNIVEAYTFNFRYYNIPGTNTVVPILSLGDNLQRMSLKDKDPVTEAVLKGNAPTLREVKRSVKSLLKTLIHAMSQMDVLPKRRFATFKLFYNDKAPLEYEPPHFQAGDAEKDKWYFMTHDLDEVPDRWSIGRVNTGHHSVNLSITSIATYLPSSTRLDNATFGGITQLDPPTSLTPEQEVCMRAQQREEQLDDADDRNIAWSGEDNVDMDADGEDDPEYVQLSDGTYEKRPLLEAPAIVTPVGIKNDHRVIEPLPMEVDQSEVCFVGVTEVVPARLAELAGQDIASDIEQTQSAGCSSTPLAAQLPEAEAAAAGGVQSEPMHSIECTSVADELGLAATDKGSTDHNKEIQKMAATNGVVDKGLDCECGVTIEDFCCFCEGGCGRWYHVWCMGYHSVKDTRMPGKFVCFDCRLRADLTWELVKNELYPRIISKFRELALFRRAIKVVELMKPTTLVEFTKFFGSDHGLARQLFKRLESEGFISNQCAVVDDSDLTGRSTRNKTKTKAKVAKKKMVQKPVFAFNRAIKSSQAYLDYFNPDPEVESRLMGLSDLKTTSTSYIIRDNAVAAYAHPPAMDVDDDSQTQEETQLVGMAGLSLDERRDGGVDRPRKRIKISVTMGVDLAE